MRTAPIPFTLQYLSGSEVKNEKGFDSYRALEERIKELSLTAYTLVCEE